MKRHDQQAAKDTTTLGEALTMGLISVRTYNVLTVHGCVRVDDLRARRLEAVLWRGIGAGAVSQIDHLLEQIAEGTAADHGVEAHPDETLVNGVASTNTVAPSATVPGSSSETAMTAPLARLLAAMRIAVSESDLAVLRQRLNRTLREIARDRGVTPERVRQMESRALRQLVALLASEQEYVGALLSQLGERTNSEASLVDEFVGGAEDEIREQRELGRICLRHLKAEPARGFDHRPIEGLWALDRSQLTNTLRQASDIAPCEDEVFTRWLMDLDLDPAVNVRDLLNSHRSPVKWNPTIDGWVRSIGADRDAAWLLLQRSCQPVSIKELSSQLDRNPHALEEALRRDERFQQLRPSGRWAIADWNARESDFDTTLEAVLDTLEDLGPQTLAQLTRNVVARHPVSRSAVAQCLDHEAIGRWPDGRVGLVAHGASRTPETRPAWPGSVFLEEDGRVVAWRRVVDRDVLRGSGLGIPRFITWFLEMGAAPDELRFRLQGDADLTVRRRVQGSSISSLRLIVRRLGAENGCVLILRLTPATRIASVALGCSGHAHLTPH